MAWVHSSSVRELKKHETGVGTTDGFPGSSGSDSLAEGVPGSFGPVHSVACSTQAQEDPVCWSVSA